MNKANLAKRIFTCVVFPPPIFLILYYCKAYYHLVPCLIIFAISLAGSFEMKKMLFGKNERPLIPWWLPSMLIAAEYAGIWRGKPNYTQSALMFLITVAFATEIFRGEKDEPEFSKSIGRVSRTILMLIYPNWLLTSWPLILNIDENGHLLFLFMLVLVFTNDISCYCAGMLFGKGSRGFIKASPKKSIAGFVGGFVITPAIGLLYTAIFPSVGHFFLTKASVIFLCVLIAVCADVGDLIESVLKRSSLVKDSGNVIPGRGGMLDCIDSILASGVVYYLYITSILDNLEIIEEIL